MSYVALTLAPGEIVVARGHIHWLLWLRAWAALVFLGVFVVGVLYFLHEFVRIANTEIALTDRRLILKTGFLNRSTRELELSSVEAISLNQDLLGRILGAGWIRVHGTGDIVWKSPMIAAPMAFRRQLEAALSGNAR